MVTLTQRGEAIHKVDIVRRRDGFSSSRRPNSSIQGYPEVLPEATANQPDQLGIARLRSSGMEENSEDGRCYPRSQPHRRRQCETRSPQIPTAPSQQRCRTTASNVSSINENQDYTCPHCDRTFTSLIVLVGHLRIHRTDTGEPVPEAPTYTHRTCLHCPHCPRTFTHRMGLFGHMRIYESGIDHNSDTPTTPIMPSTTLAPSICATTNASSEADSDTVDFSCPHCPRTFTSRIGLVGHLRIHRTETGEPVPGAPTYIHQARLNCPHCPRTFRHRMGLFSHMRIHDDLR
nr:unnamed protein product [Spirometra erinaceieuropaei]